ncbi:hypothetical protein SprV_0602076700 [Sparganum proliferum]
MIRVLLHARIRKYHQRIDQEKTGFCELIGEIGTNLLLQRVAERARKQRVVRDAALENRFRKLPNPVSPRNDKLVHKLTKDQMKVLRHEAFFNTAVAKTLNMISAVESILSKTEAMEETKSLIRHQVSFPLMAHRSREVHSDGAPLRPIVSLNGTPTYGLAKWLFRRLKFLTTESDTTVYSSAQFLEKLKGDLAIETIELLLQSKYDETENRLGHAQALQLLRFCLRTYFTFDGTIHEQVKGTPIGPSISGFIAEAVLQRLNLQVFQHHRPKFWVRYVDDTFVVIDRDQLLTFKECLNAVFRIRVGARLVTPTKAVDGWSTTALRAAPSSLRTVNCFDGSDEIIHPSAIGVSSNFFILTSGSAVPTSKERGLTFASSFALVHSDLLWERCRTLLEVSK